ncbi:hypothetical protein JX265_010830 [Neoarthrinium moseri]|uniref:Uncharacterized protein n=1 Tax=Neoarthrinium moseri TaxID=1658444 RepID=A0A9P9WDJ0_9PEZI|nr:hypothetical protein JX265_010830 [Neoarthrinium moseri]
METSAPKRRKTSPTSNVPVSSGSDSHSSDRASTRSTSTRPPPRARRASFASPTKASLARSNPDILERRNASRAASQTGAPTDEQPASAESNDNGNGEGDGDGDEDEDENEDEELTAQLEGASEHRPTSDPVEPEPGPGPEITEPRSPIQRPMGGMGARPRRSLNKPSPRPLPPPSAHEEELLDPFKGRVLRRSPPRGVLPAHEPEEPELPPTPTQKGISDPAAASTSPLGIHNTPSKRPRRSRALADKLRSGSSPLKQPPLRPLDLAKGKPSSSQTLAQTSRTTSKGAEKATSGTQQQSQHRKQQEVSLETPHLGRGLKEPDPFAEKKALRDSLQVEVAQLVADLDVARRENDRLHSLQEVRRSPVPQEPQDKDALFDLLRRHALPPEKERPPEPSQLWLEAALDPMAFLPFGNPTASLPNPFQRPEKAPEDQPEPTSHHPVSLTADEELPYLQLFTPLTFTSSTTLLPHNPEADGDGEEHAPIIQRHSMSVSSSPRGLFAARIDMLVNTRTLTISDLSVPKLDPAAATELGPFVRKILDTDAAPVSALRRNVSVLTWAMAEWTRLASKRARFWCLVNRELGTREGILESVRDMRRARKRRRRVESEPEESGDEGEREKRGFRRADFLPFLGRTSLDLDLGRNGQGDQGLGLRVEWKIGFDWTGEGNSTIGVLVQAPGKWHSRDDRGSLVGMPELFNRLVQDGGEPLDALKTVVALLVGEGK